MNNTIKFGPGLAHLNDTEQGARVDYQFALRILQLFRDNGEFKEGVFIAGGSVRDMVHGVLPKDIDVVLLVPNEKMHDAGSLVDMMHYEVFKVYAREDFMDSYTDKFPGEEERYRLIMKARYWMEEEEDHPRPPVDLLFYAERFKTLADVVDQHDFNINQFVFYIDETGQPIMDFWGMNLGTLMQVRDGLTEDRIEHVQEIARKLGWHV